MRGKMSRVVVVMIKQTCLHLDDPTLHIFVSYQSFCYCSSTCYFCYSSFLPQLFLSLFLCSQIRGQEPSRTKPSSSFHPIYLYFSVVLQPCTCLNFFLSCSFVLSCLLVSCLYFLVPVAFTLYSPLFSPFTLSPNISLCPPSPSLSLLFTSFHLVLSTVPCKRELLYFLCWVKCCALFCSNEVHCFVIHLTEGKIQ